MESKTKKGKIIVKMTLEERDKLLPVLDTLCNLTETILEEDEFRILTEITDIIS